MRTPGQGARLTHGPHGRIVPGRSQYSLLVLKGICPDGPAELGGRPSPAGAVTPRQPGRYPAPARPGRGRPAVTGRPYGMPRAAAPPRRALAAIAADRRGARMRTARATHAAAASSPPPVTRVRRRARAGGPAEDAAEAGGDACPGPPPLRTRRPGPVTPMNARPVTCEIPAGRAEARLAGGPPPQALGPAPPASAIPGRRCWTARGRAPAVPVTRRVSHRRGRPGRQR